MLEKDALILSIPSTFEAVGMALHNAREFFRQFSVSSKLQTQNSIVLRELLVNAIEHGHDNNPLLNVQVRIDHLLNYQFKITVTDAGRGFDHSTLQLSIPGDDWKTKNRGLTLVHVFSKKCEFNEMGNSVTVHTLNF